MYMHVQLTSLELFFDSDQELILGELVFLSTYSSKCVELNPTANIEVANAFHLKHTTLHCEMYTCTLDKNLHDCTDRHGATLICVLRVFCWSLASLLSVGRVVCLVWIAVLSVVFYRVCKPTIVMMSMFANTT